VVYATVLRFPVRTASARHRTLCFLQFPATKSGFVYFSALSVPVFSLTSVPLPTASISLLSEALRPLNYECRPENRLLCSDHCLCNRRG
jgi:hypothetical protein